MTSLLERAGATGSGARFEPRPLDEILPERGDAARSRDMQMLWQAFCLERYDLVRRALDSGRTAPEIAYQLGETVHTYFRPRGLMLTGQELRRLVAEFLDPPKPAAGAPALPKPVSPPADKPKPVVVPPSTPPTPKDAAAKDGSDPPGLVTFKSPPTKRENSWTGDDRPAPGPTVSEAIFELPSSALVSVTDRETLGFDRLLARALEIARPRLATPDSSIARAEALRAIDAAIDEAIRAERQPAPSPEDRERLLLAALSEISGLGLIDRLWSDRAVRAVFVNGPKSIFVERDGALSPASEVFRDQAHLVELVNRLAEKPPSGVAEFQLRDGSAGTVVFPPAAPEGPVLTIRRAEPGNATLAGLVASDMLDQQTVSLLRIAVRARLNLLVMGPAGSGKTALLAALARDLDAATRVVTVARDRAFRWTAPAKVELVASPETPYPALLEAAERLQPDVLILDSLQRLEVEAFSALAARRTRGVVAACDPAVATASADLVVQLARGRDGLFRAGSLADATGAAVFIHEDGRWQYRLRKPAFAEKVRAAGYGKALMALLP